MDVVIPVEIGSPSLRVSKDLVEPENGNNCRISLDMLEERREQAAAVAEARHQQVARYYNKRVHPRAFRIRDLVLRKAEIGKRNTGTRKLEPNWEGPYQVIEVTNKGAYRLTDIKNNTILRYWNVDNLRKYFQ